jgi:4a-hydroxytetrahydrobiopterin dehydratase
LTRPARLADDVVQTWTDAHHHWRLEDAHLVREIQTTDYPSGAGIVAAQVALAERLDHHPVVTLEYRRLRIEVWTHDRGGVTQLDLEYAEGLDAIIDSNFAGFVL